ncbi:MAG: radical SAM protein, partial [Chlorobiaceae bacterium]|nr:radical SAM protein [Chlorobiaceae bacterium]
LEKFMLVLDKVPTVPRIHLQGVGEPLLNGELSKMVRSARSSGARVGTTTNASLMTRNTATELLNAGINRINLSVDTLDPLAFQRLRAGTTVTSVIRKISALADIRSKTRYPDTQLALALVVTPYVLEKLQDIIQLAANLGLDEVYIQNLNSVFLTTNNNDLQQLCSIDHEKYREATLTAGINAKKAGIRFLAPDIDCANHSYRCQWPFHGCNITWDGFVSPCCLQPDPDLLNFGNLFETDFETIWHSRSYRDFRARVTADCEPVCAECPARYGNMWHPSADPYAKYES